MKLISSVLHGPQSKAEKLVLAILSLLMLSKEIGMESTCWEISSFVLSHFKKAPLGIDRSDPW